jgi:hypothetical protein
MFRIRCIDPVCTKIEVITPHGVDLEAESSKIILGYMLDIP